MFQNIDFLSQRFFPLNPERWFNFILNQYPKFEFFLQDGIVELLVRYMYSGQVSVSEDQIIPLVHAAKSLSIKGLLDVPVPHQNTEKNLQPPASKKPKTNPVRTVEDKSEDIVEADIKPRKHNNSVPVVCVEDEDEDEEEGEDSVENISSDSDLINQNVRWIEYKYFFNFATVLNGFFKGEKIVGIVLPAGKIIFIPPPPF